MGTTSEPRRRKGRLHEEKLAKPPPSPKDDSDIKYFGNAAVDIIAVHGLASAYETTWSVQLENDSEQRYHWLQEKLGVDIPQARILGFEYGSEWYGEPSYTNLNDCGTELLRCILRDRRHVGRPEICPTQKRRPIIFIAHSFGGLVVKQAIAAAYRRWKAGDDPGSAVKESVRRAETANHRDFLCSVAGIIFLGTPHQGSTFSAWASLKMAVGSLVGQETHEELVKVLAANSQPLTALQTDFREACSDSSVLDLQLCCYRETRSVKLPPFIVVDEKSAFLHDLKAKNETLDANHMEMNKFHPGHDANYDKVLCDVQQILGSASKSVSARLEKWRYGSTQAEDGRNVLALWLDPSTKEQTKHFSSKLGKQQSAPYTCKWIEEQAFFVTWTDPARRGKSDVLWAHGEPASGKSVLAAYVINNLRSQGKLHVSECEKPLGKRPCGFRALKPTVLYFFCNVERSHDRPEGLLGTLIHQLLTIHDTDEVIFAAASSWKEKGGVTANAASLRGLLVKLASLLPTPIFIVVDGLDENPYATECLKHLGAIVRAASNIRLLALSQREVLLEEALASTASTVFDITNFSQTDILRFVEQRVDWLLKRRASLTVKRDAIVATLQKEARGTFELINTVIDDLDNRVAVEDVDEYLANPPSGLDDAYDRILARLAERSNNSKTRIRFVLQLLAVSARPLTVADIHAAWTVSQWMKTNPPEERVGKLWEQGESAQAGSFAIRDLRMLLGSLVVVDDQGYVTLARSSFINFVVNNELRSNTNEAKSGRWYEFSTEEANRLVYDICVAICTDTAWLHANASGGVPLLVQYTWTYWPYHLRASGSTLDPYTPQSRQAQKRFDQMLRRILQSALSFLGALGEFVTTPLEPVEGGNYSLTEYRQSLQRAQRTIPSAISALSRSRQSIPVAAKLHTDRVSVPTQLSDLPLDPRHRQALKWLRTTVNRLRGWLLRDETRVSRVQVDELFEKTDIGSIFEKGAYPDHVAALLDAARTLRLVALSFAVNPIHDALIQRSKTAGFSPIHFLVYISHVLEEAASFPFWDHTHETLDPLQSFFCNASDPQARPATFVLRSLSRNSHNRSTEGEQSHESSAVDSEELSRQLRQLSEVAAHQWVAARYAFDALGPRGDGTAGWFDAIVATPLSNLHLKSKFFLQEARDEPWPVFLDPNATLDLRAPVSMREAPFKELLKALPAMLRIAYAKYVAMLLQMFAEVPRAGVVAHFIQLSTSKEELLECMAYCRRLSAFSLRRLAHLLLVAFLYWLRMQLCPWLGAHAMSHSWFDLLLSYRHPAAYLNLQSLHDAKFWFKYILGIRLWTAIGRSFVILSQTTGLDSLPTLEFVSDTTASFYQLITWERNLFGLGFCLAILTASAKVILYEPDNLDSVVQFTIWYAIFTGYSMFNMFAGAVLEQTNATFWQGMAVVGPPMLLMFALVWWQAQALRVILYLLSWMLWPVTWPAGKLWELGLYAYAPFLKLCGVAVFIGLVVLAVWWLDKAIWDPHDMEGSRKAVLAALKSMDGLRDKVEPLQIGEFPLGGRPLIAATNDVENDQRRDIEEDVNNGWDYWPDDFDQDIPGSEEEETGEQQEETINIDEPPLPTHLVRQRDWIVPEPEPLNTSQALEKLIEVGATELEKSFGQLLQAAKHVQWSTWNPGFRGNVGGFDFFGGTGANAGMGTMDNWEFSNRRNFGQFGNDRFDEDAWRRRRGNGWRVGGLTPGSGFTGLSYYSHSDRFEWYDSLIFGGFIVLWVGMVLWLLWSWWNGEVELVKEPAKPKCWKVGLPIGPIFVGYGCEGWFWELGNGGYDYAF